MKLCCHKLREKMYTQNIIAHTPTEQAYVYISMEFHRTNWSGQDACINTQFKFLMAFVYFWAMENIYLIAVCKYVWPPTAQ